MYAGWCSHLVENHRDLSSSTSLPWDLCTCRSNGTLVYYTIVAVKILLNFFCHWQEKLELFIAVTCMFLKFVSLSTKYWQYYSVQNEEQLKLCRSSVMLFYYSVLVAVSNFEVTVISCNEVVKKWDIVEHAVMLVWKFQYYDCRVSVMFRN